LEGTFRGHLSQPPCSEQGHLQLDQAAQSPVQPGLECFQGWGLLYLSGQPVPVFHHPHGKKCLPYIQSKSTLSQFKAIAPCPISTGPAEKIFPIPNGESLVPYCLLTTAVQKIRVVLEGSPWAKMRAVE